MNYLDSSFYFDFETAPIRAIIDAHTKPTDSLKSKAIALYTAVRDNWRYDPYTIILTPENYKASQIAQRKSGNCVEKSILLIACLRAVGIPARLHLGKVKNHLAVERLMEKFGSNELTPHGMVNAFLGNHWLKMSPAFNRSLCDKFNVDPLDFDGENHSFLQEYNKGGHQFMEYTDDYGYFEDVPLAFMKEKLVEHYPQIFGKEGVTEFRL